MSSHTGTYLLQILGHMQYIVALGFFTQFDCEIGTLLKIDGRYPLKYLTIPLKSLHLR